MTAKEKYSEQQKEIKKLQRSFSKKLKIHAARFKKDDRNWGYAGDLGHIKSQLSCLDSFLELTGN